MSDMDIAGGFPVFQICECSLAALVAVRIDPESSDKTSDGKADKDGGGEKAAESISPGELQFELFEDPAEKRRTFDGETGAKDDCRINQERRIAG